MSFDKLLQDIEDYLSNTMSSLSDSYQKPSSKSQPKAMSKLTSSQESILEEKFDGWQAPIKGTFYNSGAYQIGDKRHGGKHNGVDLRVSGGTTAYPIGVGIVEKVASWEKGGNIITILHPKGVRTYYAHMGTVAVKPGQFVDKGTPIGSVGASGNARSTFPHIHLETKVNGALVNPDQFFSIPPYTKVDKSKEKAWVSSEHQELAKGFNMKQHLQYS